MIVLEYISLNIPEHIYKYYIEKNLKRKLNFINKRISLLTGKPHKIMTFIEYVFIKTLLS